MRELIIMMMVLMMGVLIWAFCSIDDTRWENFEACHIERSGSLNYCFLNWVSDEQQAIIEYKQCVSQTDDLKWCFKWIDFN